MLYCSLLRYSVLLFRFSTGDYSTARNIYNKVLHMNPGSEVAREARVRARDCQKEMLEKRN